VDLSHPVGADWVIGGPMFFDPAAQATDNPRFRRDTLCLIPSIARSSYSAGDRLTFYAEVYTDRHPDAAYLQVDVEQRLGHHHFVDTVTWRSAGPTIPIVYRSGLPGLRSGEAILRLTLCDSAGRPLGIPVERPFWMDWSVSGLILGDWDEAVGMLVYIAGADEMSRLRHTPPEQREAALAAFWKSKDPSPETEENEWEVEYYRRIRYADQQFTTMSVRGWRTDFGMVYVRYGEPDEIERYPFEPGSKPYQIWYYYGQQRRFLFVDARGNGDYELQYPYDGIIR